MNLQSLLHPRPIPSSSVRRPLSFIFESAPRGTFLSLQPFDYHSFSRLARGLRLSAQRRYHRNNKTHGPTEEPIPYTSYSGVGLNPSIRSFIHSSIGCVNPYFNRSMTELAASRPNSASFLLRRADVFVRRTFGLDSNLGCH